MVPAGTRVPVTITYLEMTRRPGFDRPSLPNGPPTVLLAAEKPPVWYFLNLYSAVGGPWEWTDKFATDPEELRAYVQDPKVTLYTLMRAGWPAGFFLLDARQNGAVELGYLGLVPEAIGLGLGDWLLKTAIHAAWDIPGTKTVKLETCTLDHPRALGLYQKAGFTPVGQAEISRVLSRDRDMPSHTEDT